MKSASVSAQHRPPARSSRKEGSPPPLSLRELGGLFGNARDPMALLDRRGRILHVNPAAGRILGQSAEALKRLHFMTLIHPADRAGVRRRLRELSTDGFVSGMECRLRQSADQWLPVQWSVSLEQGSARISAVGRDLTRSLLQSEVGRRREGAALRLCMAGELHDGILQTMAAGGLQLEVARRLVRTDAAAAEGILKNLAELIMAEQREIRLFVDELTLEEPLYGGRTPVADRIRAMLALVESVWEVQTMIEVRLDRPFEAEFERGMLRIVQEAVVNAVRHGKAATVWVDVTAANDCVSLRVRDDGRGFPFHGELQDDELRKQRLGPVSLKRRVAQAGGQVAIRSTPGGTTLHITLPTAEEVS